MRSFFNDPYRYTSVLGPPKSGELSVEQTIWRNNCSTNKSQYEVNQNFDKFF